jgi:hypothetical protein
LGAVHRQPFEVDGRGDVVSAAGVGEQVRQQIAAGLGPVDQMMMRVDDRQFGFDDLLAAPVEPVLPDRQMRADCCRRGLRLHRLASLYPGYR